MPLAAATAFVLGTPAGASAAAAPLETTVTMVSDLGDGIGRGEPHEYDATNSTIAVSNGAEEVTVEVNASNGDYSLLNFAVPAGQRLTRGYYPYAQRTSSRAAGHPGIDISLNFSACNAIDGRFEIRDIIFDAAGAITRFQALYEQRCDEGMGSLFGEIRFQQPAGVPLLVAPTSITWPDTYPATFGTAVPVTVRNTSAQPVRFDSAAVSGPDAGDFTIPADNCTGILVAAGASCAVSVQFSAHSPGPRWARLQLATAAGPRTVELNGTATPGHTGWTMRSARGDIIGNGLRYNFTPVNRQLRFQGAPSTGITATAAGGGALWSAAMAAPEGQTLARGTYTGVTLWQGTPTDKPSLRVNGNNGHICDTVTGSFTVNQITYVRDTLARLDATFVQHCNGAAPALRGRLQYRAAADVTSPAKPSAPAATAAGTHVHVSWTNPTATDFSYVVVRYLRGTTVPRSPTTGFAAYSGPATSADVAGLIPGAHYTFALFAVDRTGNVSPPAITRS